MLYQVRSPRVIILDLDNTLYDYNFAHQAALYALQKSFIKELNLSPLDFKRRYYSARRLVKTRLDGTAISHSRLLYIKAMLDNLSINDPCLVLTFESVYWKAYFRHMKLYKDVLPFLSLMNKEGMPVVIVSDLTLRVQLEKIIHLKINRFTRFILTSEETGFEKPSTNNFREVCKIFRVRPYDIWVIGDDRLRDVQAAVNIDAQPILINRDAIYKKIFHKTYLEVNSFHSLIEVYKQIKSAL